MPEHADLDDDDRALLRSVLEEEEPPEPDDAAIAAALEDPVLAGIVERALKSKERLVTEKGLLRMRRTLVVLFLTDPRAMSLLAQVRQGGDGSAAVPIGKGGTAPGNQSGGTP